MHSLGYLDILQATMGSPQLCKLLQIQDRRPEFGLLLHRAHSSRTTDVKKGVLIKKHSRALQELLTFEGGEDLSYLIDAEVYLTPSIATKTITAYKNVNQRNNSRKGFMQHIYLSQIRTWSMPLLGQPLRSLKPIPVIASTEERLDTSTIAYFENNPPCILLVIVVLDKNA